MVKTYRVLIVEHERLLVDVLNHAFTRLSTRGRHFKFNIVDSCSAALKVIETSVHLDMALVNINIPPCHKAKPLFIESVSLKLRYKFPRIKLLVFSSYKGNTYLSSLFNTLNPDCVLVKSDVDFKELLVAIKSLIYASPYYSKTVLQYMRRYITKKVSLDEHDKSILYYLSMGIKMKDIPKYIGLSQSAVELRKRKLKQAFDVEKQGDYELIVQAEKHGFI
ncbi:MAG: hypothetical protein AAFX55_01485 [Bacteroidota bacterium]